ncbi:hypothetical protein ACOXXE_20510 [Pseudomonas mediterranea]|uniref:hypothetical protein n=1 Tax=Pseudomonas mediterranea TaxID=183795 RepID=UPI003BF4EAE6
MQGFFLPGFRLCGSFVGARLARVAGASVLPTALSFIASKLCSHGVCIIQEWFLPHETFFMKPTPATKRRALPGLRDYGDFHENFLIGQGIYLAGYPNL